MVIYFILFLVLFISSCKEEKVKTPAERIVEVRTVPVKEKELTLEYKTTGFLEAVDRIRVKPLVSGKVEKIFVEEGQKVKKGQPLLKIEDSDFRLLLKEAQWNLEQAKRELENKRKVYERRKFLYEKELISREEFESVKTQLEVLEARISSLKAVLEKRKVDLERTLLRSPTDGYVLKRLVSVGDVVGPQVTCFEVIKLSPLRFVFNVPQEMLGSVKKGKTVKIRIQGKVFKGKISFLSPSADESRMVTVKVLLKNEDGFLKPNMFGEVSFPHKRIKAVLVPEQAVQLFQRQSFVWVVRNSRAVKVPVKVIGHREDSVAVVGNFKKGDRVIVENLLFLREGIRVKEV